MTVNTKDMLQDIEAVIFDMDGTLIDSMWIWPDVDREFLEKYHLAAPKNFQERMEGKSYTEVAAYFLKCFPELPLTIDEVKKEWTDMTYEKYTTEVKLKEGVREFMNWCRNAGIRLGIATSNARELADATLKALAIADYFDSVRTSCEAAAGKPAPDVYLLVAKDMAVRPERCLVFEDVPMGILAGKNAGMRVCGIDDEFSRPQEEKKRALSDYYIRDYRDICLPQAIPERKDARR